MKYCKNCGSKLNENSKFCKNCGFDLINQKERKEKKNKINIKEEKKEIDVQNILLTIGIILIIFSSLIFAYTSWKDLSNLFKVIFIVVEILIFFGLAFVAKKLENIKTYKSCYFLGVIFIPVLLVLINRYNLIGSYFNNGSALHVYLSLISFICLIIYFISYKFVDKKFISLSICSLISLIINASLAFAMDIMISILIINIGILISILLSLKNNNKILHFSLNIILFIFAFINCFIGYTYENYKILSVINSFVYIISLYINSFYNEKNILSLFTSFISSLVISFSLDNIFRNNISMFIYIMSLVLFLIILISFYYKEKNLKDMSMFTFIIWNIILLLFSINDYKSLLILNIIMICFFAISTKIKENKILSYLVIPINIYIILFSLSHLIFKLDNELIILLTSVIIFLLYILFKKNKFFKFYYIFFIIISTITMNKESNSIAIYLNLIIWICYYIYNIKDNINYLFLCGALSSTYLISELLHLNIFYLLLILSFIILISYEFIKNDIYLIIGSCIIIATIIIDYKLISTYAIISLCLVYVYSYYKIMKLNKYDILRLFNTLFGLILIFRIIKLAIDPIVIVSILSLFIYFVILVVMYLSEKETNLYIIIYSLVTLIPYYFLITNISPLEDIFKSLVILPFIIYSLVIPYAVNYKDKTPSLIISIILSILAINPSVKGTIFGTFLSIILLIYGLIFKEKSFIIYGIVYLVISIFIGLYSILNNFILPIILVFIGICFIIFSLINDSKKGKEDEIKK